jgi:pyrroloquinoline quinone biosynthesis protein B
MRALAAALVLFAGCAKETPPASCPVSLIVLGVAQDGGKPQIANPKDPAWKDPSLKRLATSLALVDRRGGEPRRWLFEATPDIREELQRLDDVAPPKTRIGLDGIFLTHAHIGHYSGLMFLGHESAGADAVPVYVMPRMADYLGKNGPWSQLVKYENIILAIMQADTPEEIAPEIDVTPFLVPHRQEFSEVVGYRIKGPRASALFIPDIDSWDDFDKAGVRIEDLIASVDVAYLDATFYANGEIPGRDMSGFPHPFVSASMARFAALPEKERGKIRFIHMNHTNPLLNPAAPERQAVEKAGFNIAEEGEQRCL